VLVLVGSVRSVVDSVVVVVVWYVESSSVEQAGIARAAATANRKRMAFFMIESGLV
jgi:hypothetical protein